MLEGKTTVSIGNRAARDEADLNNCSDGAGTIFVESRPGSISTQECPYEHNGSIMATRLIFCATISFASALSL
jgi:hypothetical protein